MGMPRCGSEVESLLRYEPDSARFLEHRRRSSQARWRRTSDRSQMIGRQLGPYTIVAPLGAGGMGEVYRARDSKLGRDVAIKILPSHFTRSRAPRPLRARSAPAGDAQPSAHRRDLWTGRDRWRHGAGPRAGRRADARRSPGARAAADRRRARDRAPDRRGARRRPREGHRPSRSEARQHRAAKLGKRIRGPIGRRAREGARLRPGQDDGRRIWTVTCTQRPSGSLDGTDRGAHSRHAGLHEPRAGARAGGRQAHRHLGVRLRAVRDAGGTAAVRGRDDDGHARPSPRARARLGRPARRHS